MLAPSPKERKASEAVVFRKSEYNRDSQSQEDKVNPKAVSILVFVFVAFASVSDAADVTGTMFYDDLPIASVFPDAQNARVVANPVQGGAQIFGFIDPASSTYTVEGLDAVEYRLSIVVYRTYPSLWLGYPGDLGSNTLVQPTDPGESIELDMDTKMYYHVVSPIDTVSPLDGLRYDCTSHPSVAYPVTFAIEPVPRATSYRFDAALAVCPSSVIDHIYIEATDPSAQIEWGTAEEDYQVLSVFCSGASGKPLCAVPMFQYSDGEAWRLALIEGGSTARSIHRTDAVVLPAVAGTPGAQGTYWSTAMTIANLADADRSIDIFYTPRDSNGRNDYTMTTVSISAHSQRSWADVLAELFATTGAGALELRGVDLAVTSRTSTPAAASGSFGQGIPPLQPDQVLSSNGTDTATVGGLEETAAFRTNLGLCETWGESVTVRVTILDEDMTELGHRDVALRPYENTQINRVAEAVAGVSSLSGGLARVTALSGDGRVGAYLSVVDGATGDPTFIAIAPQTPAGG